MARFSNLSASLTDSLVSSDLQSVTIDLAEAFADTLLEDGLAKDIPVIGTIYKLAKYGVSVRDRLFVKKLLCFFSEISQISVEDRARMISKIDQSGEFRMRVGEKLLYILDKPEDHENARIVAVLFRAFIDGKLTYAEFLRASRAIQSVMTDDLWSFVEEENNRWSVAGVGVLLSAGLCEMEDPPIWVEDEWDRDMGSKYRVEGAELSACISDLGSKVRSILRCCTKGANQDDKLERSAVEGQP